METSNQPVSPLRQRMLEDMRMRKLAPKTREAYIRAVSRFAKYLGRSPDTATAEDLRGYQLHLVDSGTSPITLNATITGLKFLFDVTLGHAQRDRNHGQEQYRCDRQGRYCSAGRGKGLRKTFESPPLTAHMNTRFPQKLLTFSRQYGIRGHGKIA